MDLIQYIPRLLGGLVVSLQLTVIAVVCGYILGLFFALGSTSRRKAIRWSAIAFVEIGRGIPALVLLYMVYFGLPAFGLLLSNFTAAACALIINTAAYSAEIIRAGIKSVPSGQLEASQALGISPTATFINIILPQGLRSSIPALMGLAIMMFQATSLAYTISVNELMSQGYQVSMITFEYLNVYALTGLVYALVAVPSTWLSIAVERRLSRGVSVSV